jgi:hypothetical protein
MGAGWLVTYLQGCNGIKDLQIVSLKRGLRWGSFFWLSQGIVHNKAVVTRLGSLLVEQMVVLNSWIEAA